jgi:hypothetical protein
MLSELLTFVELGFRHITDPGALDHVLFLLALAAIYRLRDWREVVWVVTAFTVGHSVTLVLAVTRVVSLPPALIEFLIPLTIVLTGIENVLVRDRATAPWRGRYRPVFAGVFGLVHGAGFANYLNSLFMDRIAIPLLGFNIGIELGQILVIALVCAMLELVDRALALIRLPSAAPTPLRLRVLAVSAVVSLVAGRWAAERTPW